MERLTERLGKERSAESHVKRVNDDHVASVIVQELAKDARMSKPRPASGGQNGPATDKQLEYLRNLGVTIPAGLTKQEASSMIDAALAKQDI